MDIYTTSFCLPHRSSSSSSSRSGLDHHHHNHLSSSTSSFELPGDSRQQQQQSHTIQQQQQQAPPPSYSRHQSARSVSYSRPASIPEDTEDGLGNNNQHNGVHRSHLGESTSSSSTGISSVRGGGGNYYPQQGGHNTSFNDQANNAAATTTTTMASGGGGGLPARRSTSSLASLGQQSATTISVSSSLASVVEGAGGGDAHSTAPSSHAGHGVYSYPSTKLPSNIHASLSSANNGSTPHSVGGDAYTNAASLAAAQRATAELAEQMQKLCMEAMSAYQCMVTCSPFFDSFPLLSDSSSSKNAALYSSTIDKLPSYNFILSGGYQQVMGARGYILRTSPYQKKSIVKVPRNEVLQNTTMDGSNGANGSGGSNGAKVKFEMKNKLDEIASLTKAHLAIVGQQQEHRTSTSLSGSGNNGRGNENGNGNGASALVGGLETERFVEIVITGSYESVEQARVRLLVLLDELSGLHSDVCEIDYKLHNIISGRKRSVIQTIQEETATNIYFPTPLTGILSTSSRDPSLLSRQNLIFITGEFFGVQRARDMLFQVSLHKSKMIISRDTAILPRKLDWLLLLSSECPSSTSTSEEDGHHDKVHDVKDRLEDQVKNIMFDNGTFINFPVVGSQASLISVYGDHRVNIERTLRALMNLATQFLVAQFWLLPRQFDVFNAAPVISPSEVPAILKLISATTGAEAVFKSNCFEFHGLESEVRTAVQLLLELEIVKSFHHEIRFQIELGNEHRDFISGKKNGKLNKVMKTAGVKIKFETFNDYNFLIDIAGDASAALHGLSLLQEELPAEVSFHVPEIYHKRIIGVGGKNIQRIMKKYGVYVKFSNAEEFAALGGYHQNEDNVIARTPAKNSPSLDQLKAAVMEMVIPKDKDYIVETVSIPRRYHRTLLGEKSIFIHDIETKTSSVVRFPNKETASDVVSIFGPESQVHIAAQMLLDHVPFEAEYRLPHSEQMSQLALAQEFIDLQDQVKRELNIMLLPWVDRSGGSEDTVIKFLLNRSNQHFLPTARDTIEEFLLARQIPLHSSNARSRSDSFTASFPFFNSKILSTVGDNENSAHQSSGPSYREEQDRPILRPAASSPDIKALFEAPSAAQAYNYIPHDTTHTNTTNAKTPSPAYHYQSLYQQQPTTQQQQQQQQQQPPKAANSGLPELHTPRFYDAPQGHAPARGHHSNYSISANFVPSHSSRLSDEKSNTSSGDRNASTNSMNNKRESDPIMMDDKIKDMIRRGALGHHHLNARAQSLDISQQTKTFGRHAAPSADSEAVSAALSQLRL